MILVWPPDAVRVFNVGWGGRGWTEGKPRCIDAGVSRCSNPGHPPPVAQIDDPLIPNSDQAPTPRLTATVKSLNRKQIVPLLRFHVGGNGVQVSWEWLNSNGEGENHAPETGRVPLV